MIISRQLANQVGDRLQLIVSLIEIKSPHEAIRAAQELAAFLNRYVETEEEEKQRLRRPPSTH